MSKNHLLQSSFQGVSIENPSDTPSIDRRKRITEIVTYHLREAVIQLFYHRTKNRYQEGRDFHSIAFYGHDGSFLLRMTPYSQKEAQEAGEENSPVNPEADRAIDAFCQNLRLIQKISPLESDIQSLSIGRIEGPQHHFIRADGFSSVIDLLEAYMIQNRLSSADTVSHLKTAVDPADLAQSTQLFLEEVNRTSNGQMLGKLLLNIPMGRVYNTPLQAYEFGILPFFTDHFSFSLGHLRAFVRELSGDPIREDSPTYYLH